MENIEVIKEQFAKVISFSQGIAEPHIDELFKNWYNAKQQFIKAFGNQLIFEMPDEISFELGEMEKQQRISEFIRSVENHWGNPALAEFIDNNRHGFFANQVLNGIESDDGIKIPKGMKLVKAIKFFEKDEKALADIQNMASRIIQESKISGKLCLSVHPLDFLSSSENTYNWRSCHALDGEYRSGNLSYMVDQSTIICYLKSKGKEEILPNFPSDLKWNSKKWRMLLFFSNDMTMMFAGRQYPFVSSTALDIVTSRLLPQTHLPHTWTKWSNKKVRKFNDDTTGVVHTLNDAYVPVGGQLKAMHDLIHEGESSMCFNDLLSSSCYDPYYCYAEGFWAGCSTGNTRPSTHFVIGGPINCLDCGKDIISISETMRCTYCEEDHGSLNTDDFGYCACCGRHLYYDNATWVGDDPICPQCASSEVEQCDDCGDVFYKEDIIYDRASGASYCPHCARRHHEED